MIFLQLFWEFLKTGLFAVGGGLATLPFLKAITHKYPWFTANDLMDMIAVSESTPGPMGVNSATYAGFHAAGLPGALTAQPLPMTLREARIEDVTTLTECHSGAAGF